MRVVPPPTSLSGDGGNTPQASNALSISMSRLLDEFGLSNCSFDMGFFLESRDSIPIVEDVRGHVEDGSGRLLNVSIVN